MLRAFSYFAATVLSLAITAAQPPDVAVDPAVPTGIKLVGPTSPVETREAVQIWVETDDPSQDISKLRNVKIEYTPSKRVTCWGARSWPDGKVFIFFQAALPGEYTIRVSSNDWWQLVDELTVEAALAGIEPQHMAVLVQIQQTWPEFYPFVEDSCVVTVTGDNPNPNPTPPPGPGDLWAVVIRESGKPTPEFANLLLQLRVDKELRQKDVTILIVDQDLDDESGDNHPELQGYLSKLDGVKLPALFVVQQLKDGSGKFLSVSSCPENVQAIKKLLESYGG